MDENTGRPRGLRSHGRVRGDAGARDERGAGPRAAAARWVRLFLCFFCVASMAFGELSCVALKTRISVSFSSMILTVLGSADAVSLPRRCSGLAKTAVVLSLTSSATALVGRGVWSLAEPAST